MSNSSANNKPSSPKTSASDKKSSSLRALLDIWKVLAEKASVENPMTISDIANYLDDKRTQQIIRSNISVNRARFGYSNEEAATVSAENAKANISLPTSGKTVHRHMPGDIDAINTIMPHTVVCEKDVPTPILTYVSSDKLHIVVEDPNGKAKYEGDVAVVFNEPPVSSITKASLNRKLPTLVEQFRAANKEMVTSPPALSVSDFIQKNGKYVPAPDYALDTGRSSTRYYYLKSLLTNAEWKIFYDLVCVYPYISKEQTAKFLSVLTRIAPGNQDWPTMRYAPKAEASLQFSNIEILDKAIKEGKKVSLTYGIYLLEQDKNHVLRPVLKPQLDFRKKISFVHVVEPYAMMWSNGYYYLVGKTDKGMRNFRMDRVLKVNLLPDSFERDKDFDPYQYRDSSPVMHSGTPTVIQMRCPINLLGAVMDTFGSKVLSYSSRYALESDGKERYTNITLHASEAGAKLFAMEYADQVEILSPPELRESVASSLRAALKKYE